MGSSGVAKELIRDAVGTSEQSVLLPIITRIQNEAPVGMDESLTVRGKRFRVQRFGNGVFTLCGHSGPVLTGADASGVVNYLKRVA